MLPFNFLKSSTMYICSGEKRIGYLWLNSQLVCSTKFDSLLKCL